MRALLPDDDGLSRLVRSVVARSQVAAMDRAYLNFCRELLLVQHRTPGPDYSARARAVVEKWFRRGLSGRIMADLATALWAAVLGEDDYEEC